MARRHWFATASDTKVIMLAYEEYGEACVGHFREMFVFAIWDRNCGKLFLARDHFSKKPLFRFASITGRYYLLRKLNLS